MKKRKMRKILLNKNKYNIEFKFFNIDYCKNRLLNKIY